MSAYRWGKLADGRVHHAWMPPNIFGDSQCVCGLFQLNDSLVKFRDEPEEAEKCGFCKGLTQSRLSGVARGV